MQSDNNNRQLSSYYIYNFQIEGISFHLEILQVQQNVQGHHHG